MSRGFLLQSPEHYFRTFSVARVTVLGVKPIYRYQTSDAKNAEYAEEPYSFPDKYRFEMKLNKIYNVSFSALRKIVLMKWSRDHVLTCSYMRDLNRSS
jgi:hypothetical protein